MVQTEAQYIFLHDAIAEGAEDHVTEVSAEKLSQHIKTLERVDEEKEESGFRMEFQVSLERMISLETNFNRFE